MKLWLLCPLVLQAAAQVAIVDSFDRYPGYAGPLNITGALQISNVAGNTYSVIGALIGGEAGGNHGIHIHSGVSCAAANLVGGHFWQPFNLTDPWLTTFGMANSSGDIDANFTVDFGFTEEFFIRHAVVIHAPDSARVACGVLHAPSLTAPEFASASLSVYPGYGGNLSVLGTVDVWDVADGYHVVNFRLTGLEANVTGGVHIHEGFTCATSGGHYWANHSETDPWLVTKYLSVGNGVAEGSVKVKTGYNFTENLHHAIVIHDSFGNRTACGLLGGPAPTTAPTPSPTTTAAPTTTTTTAPTAAPTASNSTSGNETCASTEIKAAFTACKKYDFTGPTCSAPCATSLQALVLALADGTLSEALACLDLVNATNPWINGDLPTLKDRINFDGEVICNTTAPPTDATSGAVAVSGSFLAALLAFFL